MDAATVLLDGLSPLENTSGLSDRVQGGPVAEMFDPADGPAFHDAAIPIVEVTAAEILIEGAPSEHMGDDDQGGMSHGNCRLLARTPSGQPMELSRQVGGLGAVSCLSLFHKAAPAQGSPQRVWLLEHLPVPS